MISAVVLLTGVITHSIIIIYSARALRQESFSKVREIAYMHSHVVEKDLGDIMSMARACAVSIYSIMHSGNENPRRIIMKNMELFLDYLPARSAVWAMFETDAGGRRFTPYAYREKDRTVKRESGLWKTRYADCYKKTMYAKIETVSEVYSETGSSDLITTFCVPVTDGTRFSGVVGVDIVLSDLSALMGKIKPLDEKTFAFMISNGGIFVAHPWPVYLGHNIADPKFKSSPYVIEAVRQGKEVAEIRKSPLTGLTWYVYFVPVKIGKSDAPWSFGINIPLPVVLQETRNLVLASVINGVLSFIVLILMLFIIVRSISEPVQKTLINMQKAIEQASEAMCFIGLDRRIKFVNPAMEKFIRKSAAELVGMAPLLQNSEGVHPEDIWQTLDKGNIWSGIITDGNGDTSCFNLEITITPIRDEKGIISGYLEIGRDITHEIRMEAQLRQSQKMEVMGSLAGGIAHDFNNILGAIFGYAELALVQMDDSTDNARYIRNLLKVAERARDLVNQILIFSRKTEQEYRPIRPGDILRDVMKLLRASLPSTIGIEETVNSTAVILGDETRFHQIIMNLCTNAAHAMQDTGGTIRIVLDDVDIDENFMLLYPGTSPGRTMRLTISDNGYGITPDNLERIFEPFFTTKGKGSGTGLGLAVVHGIVKSFGGIITVKSEIGEGTEFTVYLPIASNAVISAEKQSFTESAGGTERILLVDDEPDLVLVEKEMLENLGYRVKGFTDCEEALDEFRKDPSGFDLILTDCTMPKMTGIDLAVILVKIRPDIPIVLFSGYFDKSTEEKAKQAGIKALIHKPITADVLASAIHTLMKHR